MDYEVLVRDFILIFTSIVYEAMPFIVLGAVVAGLLEELVPRELIANVVPKNRFMAIVLSSLLGLIFPMCECGIVPVMRRLLRKGLPLGCCTAYLLAGPIINPIVIGSTVVAFKPHDERRIEFGEFTTANGETRLVSIGSGTAVIIGRVLGGFLVAVGTSLVVERLYRKHGNALLTLLSQPPTPHVHEEAAKQTTLNLPVLGDAHDHHAHDHHDHGHHDHDHGHHHHHDHAKPSLWTRLGNIAETSLHDFVDITVFLILGALLAATSRMVLTHDRIQELSSGYPVVSILLMMGLAILLCLCSEADAFVAASFTQLQPSAKLAFLVLGPMLDFKLYFMYTRVFRPKLIFTIFGCVIAQVFVFSMLVQLACTSPAIHSAIVTIASWVYPLTSAFSGSSTPVG